MCLCPKRPLDPEDAFQWQSSTYSGRNFFYAPQLVGIDLPLDGAIRAQNHLAAAHLLLDFVDMGLERIDVPIKEHTLGVVKVAQNGAILEVLPTLFQAGVAGDV